MKFSNTIKSIMTLIVSAMLFSNFAAAQSTILVVDQARVLRDSDVGKHIARQMQSIGTQMQSELKSKMTPFVSERDNLMSELQNMSSDALASRPDLKQRAVTLQAKGQANQREAAYLQRELQITEQKALLAVNAKLETILEALVKERGADVILDRSLVIYSGTSSDVTDMVISRLNSQMRTVSVVRERLPRTAPGQ